MPAGRPKKPSKLKELQNTARKDRELPDEMMPAELEHVPSAPKFMSVNAKLEWKSVCRELLSMGMLHSVDLGLLAAYCMEMSQYIEAVEVLKSSSPVITLNRPDGSVYEMPSPWVAIKNSALKNAQSIANSFGFTPAARTKISASRKGDKSDFDKMLEME